MGKRSKRRGGKRRETLAAPNAQNLHFRNFLSDPDQHAAFPQPCDGFGKGRVFCV